MGGGRQTAIALVLAILGSELLLNGRGQAMWGAMWGQPHGLGQESGGGGGGGSDTSGGLGVGANGYGTPPPPTPGVGQPPTPYNPGPSLA